MANTIIEHIKSIPGWINRQLVVKKMDSPLGWLLMALVGIAIAYYTSTLHEKVAILICLAAIAIGVVVFCIKRSLPGYYIVIAISSVISMPDRLLHLNLPYGLMIEVMSYLVFIGVLARQYRERRSTAAFWNNPISIILIVQMAYYVIEIFNPQMQSYVGWVFFFRRQVNFMVFYYMTYLLIDSYAKVIFFLKFWIVLTLFIALYGIKQQWFGFFEFEETWVRMNPQRLVLFYQTGFMRKFSVLTDPAGFGICMSSIGILTLILGLRSAAKKRRIFLTVSGLLMLLSSTYSGTRTANLMVIAGVMSYLVFTLNEKRSLAFAAGFLVLAAFLWFGPFKNNPVVYRMKTTFEGSSDASASVRDINRHSVQPYIQAHPLGGGINTCGGEGLQYNPNHYLATFPPDSGYMKILAEQGWIGYAIHMIFYFIVIRMGLLGFYKARNAEIKNIYIAITVFMFVLLAGEISQITNGGYPYSYFYYPLLVIIYKLIDYDTPQTEPEIR